ncbi:MAG: DUF2828 domain-containing protein [Eubacteriaceae bacterium]|nr:DUF2828 domain-containing protein [Eubacteriaceae bacterium]
MLNFLKKEANKTLTENLAMTNQSTNSFCLDLFATIGALRSAEDGELINRFDKAWAEDADLAMKTLFFARDIRGGLGERRVFRVMLKSMAAGRSASIEKNLWAIPEFGRYDDMLALLDTPAKEMALNFMKNQFELDLEALKSGGDVSLLGKWLPSINASNAGTIRFGKIIAKHFGCNEAEYRKSLSALRAKIAIIENNLRTSDYTFDYSKQPSKAMLKYRKAFLRNDNERYIDYLGKVQSGEAKMNVGTLLPYEIIRPAVDSRAVTQEERYSMDVAWKAQADFTNNENALVVIDGSGSMYWNVNPSPASIALSLGVYFAERNTGAFKNHFITFSLKPQLVEIKGIDIYDKVRYAMSFNEAANTNVAKVFDLVLSTAVKNKVAQNELPSTLYIISDMEFDYCAKDASLTNFEYAKKQFARHGYELPTVVFWNVDNRNQQQPVTMDETGTVLVSGSSPRIFSMISSGNLSPYAFMLETLGSERYAKIKAL